MEKKLDNQTEKIFTQGEQLKSMVGSAGWAIAKEMLLKRTAQLLNIADISTVDANTIVQLIGIRQETAKNLIAWMKDIEGTVEQHKANTGAFSDIKDGYIINLDQLE